MLLITSRETGRWVVPKGWPIKRCKPHRVAEVEAHEEAGVVGTPAKRELGCYEYEKRLEDGSSVSCEVHVFPLKVTRLEDDWPEATERERRWFTPDAVAALVEEPGLSTILGSFSR